LPLCLALELDEVRAARGVLREEAVALGADGS
jgi:hypothetical protein